jgi:hypothetical protein
MILIYLGICRIFRRAHGRECSQKLSLGGDVYSSPGQLLVSILNVNHSHGTLIAKNPPFPYLLLECLGPVEEGRLL